MTAADVGTYMLTFAANQRIFSVYRLRSTKRLDDLLLILDYMLDNVATNCSHCHVGPLLFGL